MAKLALTWRESLPPPEEKREAKVVRLLRDGDAASSGATEARSSFVYPVSLLPLRKIAGAAAEGSGGVDLNQAAEAKEPADLDVSQLLEQVFPAATEGNPGGDHKGSINNGTSNGLNNNNNNNNADTDTGTRNDTSNKNGNAAAPGSTGHPSPLDRHGSSGGGSNSARAQDKRGTGKGKTRAAVKPTFHAYGSANTAPSSGGVVYGGYMLSHSISPQVFPNKPRTRQVYSGTQRVAVRAAAKARAASAKTSRISSSSSTATTRAAGALRMGSGSSNPGIVGRDGGHVRGFARNWARGRLREEKVKSAPAGAGAGAGGKEGVGAVGDEDDARRGSAATFDPVALFSALPEDIEPWGVTKTGGGSATKTPQRAAREDSGTGGGDCPSGKYNPASPTAVAVNDAVGASTEKRDAESRRAAGGLEQGEVAPSLDERSRRQHQQHEWTVDSHLANDPRNYKFLPRGWAGKLITPAGITGPRPSSTEASIPGWTAGRSRKGGGAGAGAPFTDCYRGGGGDECGVGDCLRWNPGS